MHLDTGNRFQSFVLSEEETRMACTVSPYTLAYLQNKITHYAGEVLNRKWHDDKDSPNADKMALLDLERLRAQVEVLEELFQEFQTPEVDSPSTDVAPPEVRKTPEPPAPLSL